MAATKNGSRKSGKDATKKSQRSATMARARNGNVARGVSVLSEEVPLRNHAERALTVYFANLNGHRPAHLYDLVLREIEEPLIRIALTHSQGNQSQAAGILGINRATLRKKLREFGLSG